MSSILPAIGGIVGGIFGGPWGAALGSAAGEALGGGSVSQDLTAGAVGGLGSWAGGSLFGSGTGGASGGAAADASQTLTSDPSIWGGGPGGLSEILGAGGGSAAASDASQTALLGTGMNFLDPAISGAAASAGGGAASLFGSAANGSVWAPGGVGYSQLAIPATGDAGGLTPGAAPAMPNGGANLPGAVPGAVPYTPSGGVSFLNNGSPAGLDPTTASALGVSPETAGAAGAAPTAGGGTSFLDSLGSSAKNWLLNNKGQAAMIGYGLYNAGRTPQLPGALQTLQGESGANINMAEGIIKSGGSSGPQWTQQKASIDAAMGQAVQQATESIMQNAANNGMGTNSLVVQQQINQMKQNAEVQQQQLYTQAQQQNVQNAMALLSGGNQALALIGQTQFNQSALAQQILAQLLGGTMRNQALSQAPASAASGG